MAVCKDAALSCLVIIGLVKGRHCLSVQEESVIGELSSHIDLSQSSLSPISLFHLRFIHTMRFFALITFVSVLTIMTMSVAPANGLTLTAVSEGGISQIFSGIISTAVAAGVAAANTQTTEDGVSKKYLSFFKGVALAI